MCVSCGLCVKQCEFLPKYCESPQNLADDFLAGRYYAKPEIAFMCTLCAKCASVCPVKLNVSEMILEIRETIREEDIPLPGNVKYVKNAQKFTTGDDMYLFKPAPSGTTKRLYFPGCGLTGYSPEMALAGWKWLNENEPDCGLLFTCCDAPSLVSGDRAHYEETAQKIRNVMADCGAEELVVICPDCMEHFRDDAKIPFVSLYEIMDASGNTPTGKSGTWIIHDPCKSRTFPEVQAASRSLLEKAGYTVVEPDKNTGKKTCCCGQGGLVAYTDAKWAAHLSEVRAQDMKGMDFVTICGACRESLAAYVPGVHLLDLLFSDNPDEVKSQAPHGMADTKKCRLRAKELFETA